MSQENVDLLHRLFAAYNSGFQTGSTSDFLTLMHPDVEWHTTTAVLDPVYRGPEGVRRWIQEFNETWDDMSVEPEEFIHVDAERVLVALRLSGRGKTSGANVDMLMYELMTIRHGRIVERRPFQRRELALEAVGLSEQDAHADS
jgi:ketosteroid isomerase-like protein